MRIIILTLLLGFQLTSLAQKNVASNKQKTSLVNYLNNSSFGIAVTNVGIGMPPNFVNGRLNPGFELGLQHNFNANTKPKKWDYALQLGYFSIKSLQRAYYIKPSIGYSIKTLDWLVVRPSLNNAFMVVSQINDEFEYTGNGNYEKVNRNRFQISPSLGIETHIKMPSKGPFSYKILLGYEFCVQLPFSELSGILPLNQLKVGLNLRKQNSKQ